MESNVKPRGDISVAEHEDSGSSSLKKYAPVAVLLAAMALVFVMGWHKYLTLESIANNYDYLQTFVSQNLFLALLAYMGLYVAVTALSLPGATALTLTGGLVFGWLIGGAATVVAATIGATIIFLIAKSAFGETLAAKAGPWMEKLRDGFKEDALSYLFFLRLVPAFPFFVVNLAPGLLGVPLRTYVFATFFGIIPGTLAYSYFGSGLGSIITAQKKAHQQCLTKGGEAAKDCTFSIDPSSLITKEIIIAFAALGIVALIPVVLKKLRKA